MISQLWRYAIAVCCLLTTAAHAEQYTYDAAGRLTGVTYDDGSSISYTYDAAGNLLNRTVTALVAGPLAAAVLPASRSAVVGGTVTAFATIINSGQGNALDCGVALASGVPATFSYQTTDATNAPVGTPDTPVDVPSGMAQGYVVSITPTGTFAPQDVAFTFDCANTDAAGSVVGLNTLLLSAANNPTPDVIALVATPNNDGIVGLPGETGSAAFAVATVNVGSGGTITVEAAPSAGVTVNTLVCETDPATSQCLAPAAATVTTNIGGGATPTFGVFVFGTGLVPFDPAGNRIFINFTSPSGVVRGSTSVAVRTE